METLDWLILTAANPAQSRGYIAQLRARQQRDQLGPVQRWMVCADPGGRRVGSGGSTLWVLYELARRLRKAAPKAGSLAELFAGKRILVIHSGGDSRRLCAYAAQGKVFTPLPCDVPGRPDQPATLFDLILAELLALPAPPRGQVLLVSGDVLLSFDPRQVDFDRSGVVGVACPGTVERAGRHGVYVAGEDGRVLDFVQKPDEATARRHGAVDAVGRVLVDTGMLSLDPPTAGQWLEMAGVGLSGAGVSRGEGLLDRIARGRSAALDLYEQLLMALPPRCDESTYLAAMGCGKAGSENEEERTEQRGRLLPPSPPGRGVGGEGGLADPAADLRSPQASPGGRGGRIEPTQQGAPDPAQLVSQQYRLDLLHIHRALHNSAFHVNVLEGCEFFHIGTTRELLNNIGGLNRTSQRYGFANFDRSVVPPGAALEGAFIYNCLIFSKAMRAGRGVLIEASHLRRGPVELAGGNVVVGFPGKAQTPLRLPEGWGLVCLPVRGGQWAAVLFGLDDDFKTPIEQGGTLGNRPMAEQLERLGLAPGQVWPRGSARSLWEAKLWVTGPIDRVLKNTLWMTRPGTMRPPRGWLGSRRVSMARLLGRIDHDRLIAHRHQMQCLGELHHLGARLLQRPWLPAASVLEGIGQRDEAAAAIEQVAQVMAMHDDPLLHARLLKLAALIRQRYPRIRVKAGSGDKTIARKTVTAALADPGRHAFAAVARAVEHDLALPEGDPPRAAILHDQVCWATTPARLDFAGGWSDTPPICTELGGTVVNAAVTLNGQYPIQVMAKLTDRPVIGLSSIDLGRRIELTRTGQVHRYTDPGDWAALPRAALVLAGLCPRDARQSLKAHLERFGGGIELTLFSALPKGSGLGTSSILGAAVLACLDRITGRASVQTAADNAATPAMDEHATAQPDLVTRTSMLEQMMTTGGGWQDQVGGITPGVKIIRTGPGLQQRPSLYWTGLDLARRGWTGERLLLYFTGQKRLARNILQNVVGRYLAREPGVLSTIQQLKAGAEQMKQDLDRGDLGAFAAGIDRYWQLKKQIDPGSTNPAIERLIGRIDRHLLARLLPGAGGGGFLFMVARDRDAAAAVRRELESHPPNPQARFFDFDIDPVGLRVTVL